MKAQFNKGLLLTSLGSFWWGFIGVIYFLKSVFSIDNCQSTYYENKKNQ